MTTIVSIDELNTATEMPRQMETPQSMSENTPAFDEAVSRFQTALGGEGLKLDAESLGLGEIAAGEMPDVPEPGKMPDVPDPGKMPEVPEAGEMPDVPEPGKMSDVPEPGKTPDVPETVERPDAQKSGERSDALETEDSEVRRFGDPTISLDPPEAQVVLQAAPMMNVPLEGTAMQGQSSDAIKVTSVDSAAAARSQLLATAVEEVCEAIQVAPGVQPGQGEVRIQLKADVLSGTEVFLEAKGATITVAFNPATADVAEILSRNITQFEQHLAGRIHNYQISAKVKRLRG